MDFFKGCFIPLTCRVYFPAYFELLFRSELSDLQVVRPDQRGAFVGYCHLLNFGPFFMCAHHLALEVGHRRRKVGCGWGASGHLGFSIFSRDFGI